jgi:uncharacterized protein (DUF2147 family)
MVPRGFRESEHKMMSGTSLMKTLIAATMLTGALAGTAAAVEPYGVWMRPSTGTQVRFYDCSGKLCGKIVGVKDQSRKSEIGTVILPGAAKSGANEWKGDLLNTENGKTYSGVVALEGKGLNLKGCVGFICQGETWTRVKE